MTKRPTPRTDVIVKALVANVMHNWIRSEDYTDRGPELNRRVAESFDNRYGEKPIEQIRQLERELSEAREKLEKANKTI